MTEETENYNNNNDNNNENSEEKTISDLRDFGFSSRISEKASFYCENNLKKCLEWIYYHQRDKDFNDQLDTNHPDETKYYKNLKRFIRKGEPGEDYDEELYDHYDDNNSHHSNNSNENKDNNLETLANSEINNSNIHNEENSNTINNNNIGDSKIVSNNNIGDSNIISDNNIGESKIVSNNNIGDSNIISNNNMNDNDNVNLNNNEKSIKDSLINIYSDTSRITERINQQKTEKEKEEEKEEKNQYSKEENISFYIKTLKKFYGTAFYGDILLNCFETIKTILDNILNNPEEEKYKNIKLNNPHFEEKVGKYEIAVKLLKEIGFVQEEGRLTLKNFDRSLIEDTVNKINDEINNLK